MSLGGVVKRYFKKIGITIVLLLGGIGIVFSVSFLYNKYAVQRWIQNPHHPGQLVNIGSHKLYATVKGEESPVVIMIPGMNAFSWGWWEIQDEISITSKVVTYDRAGYGWSEASLEPYSSRQIVTELHTLLQRLKIHPPYILVGASMGGVYAKHFTKLYPNEVVGVVFVDPAAWPEKDLTNTVQQEAVLSQSKKRSLNEISAALGVFRIFGRYFLRMHRIPDLQMSHVLEALSNPGQHRNFQKHFASIYKIDNNHYLNAPEGFPDVPVKVIVQDTESTIRDAIHYEEIKGEESEQKGRKYLRDTKERQRKDYMGLSSNCQWILAEGSGHNIQFDRPDLIIKTIRDLAGEIRK